MFYYKAFTTSFINTVFDNALPAEAGPRHAATTGDASPVERYLLDVRDVYISHAGCKVKRFILLLRLAH